MAKKLISKAKRSDLYTVQDLVTVRNYPHILGIIGGYESLTEMHSEWVRYVWEKDGEHIRHLQAHRGAFKTSGVTVTGAVWRLLFHPNQSIIIARKTFTEAADTVADIAKMMKVPEIRELFAFAHGEYPEFKTEKLGEAKIDFTFRKKAGIAPSILGMGNASTWTGKHADIIIGDDISTINSRISKAERMVDQRIWREICTSIVNKTPDCFVRYVGTPWCPPKSGGIEDLLPEPRKYTCYDTGMLTEATLADIRSKTTNQLFAANYELEFISAEDVIFNDPQYDEWATVGIDTIRAHVDFAYGGIDTTALTIGANRQDGKVQFVGFMFHGNGPEYIDRIVEIMRMYRCRVIAVETNSDKGFSVQEFRKRGITVKDYAEGTNKVNKICTWGKEVWPRAVWDKDTDPVYMNQIVDYTPESKAQDDAPDSYASICRAFYSKKASALERWNF